MILLWVFLLIGVYAASSSTLSRLHGCSSRVSGQSNADYSAWRRKRDRWFREEHLTAAALGGLIPLCVNSLFSGGSVVPVFASYVAFFAAWAVVREMEVFGEGFMWAKADMRRVGVCLISGTVACLAAGLLVAGGVPIGLCAAAWFSSCVIWCMLFPM